MVSMYLYMDLKDSYRKVEGFIALIVVFIIMSAYDKKFRNARKALNKLGININDFEKNNRAKHVLKNAVENNLYWFAFNWVFIRIWVAAAKPPPLKNNTL